MKNLDERDGLDGDFSAEFGKAKDAGRIKGAAGPLSERVGIARIR